MAVSPKILKAHGCDPKLWKALFTATNDEKLPQIKKLELLLQNRISDGQLKCLQEYRTWAAVDLAYDASFAQTTPTVIQSILSRKWEKTEDLLAQLEQWGLKEDELFLNGTIDGKACKVLNSPTFYKVIVPLVKSYVTIRWAKLFNDRNLSPLFKYEPLQPNAENRILCEILTYLVQVITADYGYSNVLKDAIFQTLMYSICLMFPSKVWDTEYQLEEDENGNEKRVLQKEGIRYSLPHVSRLFWDLAHPPHTFNTDTGCEFGGYWKVVRYGDLLDNKNYWNRKSIGYSSKGWNDPAWTAGYFQELFPCALQWPVPPSSGENTSRENQMAFYTSNERDMAVTETNVFCKLVPSKWKLGDYDEPVWVRFIVASDNTVLYAEPCCYSPILYSGYDTNSLRSKNTSLALEVLPYQDIVGNTLSQILLTCKQNLMQLEFYDKDQIDSGQIDQLKNSGELLLRSRVFIPFSSQKVARAGTDPNKAIISVKSDNKDITPLFQSISTTLSLLERLLQLSAQESGAAASHQQSKAEIDQIGNSTSNRVQFTGSFIDDLIDGWKRQQYAANQAYAQDPVEAMVDSGIPDIEEHLAKLGFEVTGIVKGEGKMKVKGKKSIIKLDALATSSKGPERKNDSQVAQVMMQAISAMAGNAELLKAIGTKPILDLMQKAAILAGADKDFKLRPDQKQEMAALQAMAEQIQIAAAKHAEETIAQPAAQEVHKLQNELQQLGAAVQGLDKAMALVIQKLGIAPQPAGQPPAQPAPPPNANPNPTPAPDAAAGGIAAPTVV